MFFVQRFIWLVERTDDIYWDEYDSCVVIAKDRDEAFKIANAGCDGNFLIEYTEIDVIGVSFSKESKVVVSSFNAG